MSQSNDVRKLHEILKPAFLLALNQSGMKQEEAESHTNALMHTVEDELQSLLEQSNREAIVSELRLICNKGLKYQDNKKALGRHLAECITTRIDELQHPKGGSDE